jgi:hypothetical protein
VIASRPMPIRRSWVRTLGWTLVTIVLLGMAVFTGYSREYLITGMLLLFGLVGIVVACSGSYISECPVCATELRGLIGLTRCPQCLSYGKISDGSYYELPPDFVNKIPVLALPLAAGREMAPLCCACGAPAVRSEKLRIIRLEFAFELNVPHCGSHSGGADLDSEAVAGKGKAQAPVLKVKSYAFYRACVKANYPEKTTKWTSQPSSSLAVAAKF